MYYNIYHNLLLHRALILSHLLIKTYLPTYSGFTFQQKFDIAT